MADSDAEDSALGDSESASSYTGTGTPTSYDISQSYAAHLETPSNRHASLGVLAEIASETLKREPTSDSPSTSWYTPRQDGKPGIGHRVAKHSLDEKRDNDDSDNSDESSGGGSSSGSKDNKQRLFSLEQLQKMTTEELLYKFTSTTQNKINKVFVCTCYLMPDTCQHMSVHKSLATAKSNVARHISSHLTKLSAEVKEKLSVSKRKKTRVPVFVAETVQARMQRVRGDSRRAAMARGYTLLKPRDKSRKVIIIPRSKEVQKRDSRDDTDEADKSSERFVRQKRWKTELSSGDSSMLDNVYHEAVRRRLPGQSRAKVVKKLCRTLSVQTDNAVVLPSEDHAYTRENPPLIRHPEEAEDAIRAETLEDCYRDEEGRMAQNILPLAKLDRIPLVVTDGSSALFGASVIGAQEVVKDGESIPRSHGTMMVYGMEGDSYEALVAEVTKDTGHLGSGVKITSLVPTTASTRTRLARKYPPMPHAKFPFAGKIYTEYRVRELRDMSQQLEPDADGEPTAGVGTKEWEKNVALECIRNIMKLKSLHLTLPRTCKLCTKKFTAPGTLVTHLRSHAGIRPYMCAICKTTFTRQHSLDYHMLIHNNLNRFACEFCDKQFRHPSHYREHQRKHTGETPYECMICAMSFQTRNTFKRHLRLFHNKHLAANGLYDINAKGEVIKNVEEGIYPLESRPEHRKRSITRFKQLAYRDVGLSGLSAGEAQTAIEVILPPEDAITTQPAPAPKITEPGPQRISVSRGVIKTNAWAKSDSALSRAGQTTMYDGNSLSVTAPGAPPYVTQTAETAEAVQSLTDLSASAADSLNAGESQSRDTEPVHVLGGPVLAKTESSTTSSAAMSDEAASTSYDR